MSASTTHFTDAAVASFEDDIFVHAAQDFCVCFLVVVATDLFRVRIPDSGDSPLVAGRGLKPPTPERVNVRLHPAPTGPAAAHGPDPDACGPAGLIPKCLKFRGFPVPYAAKLGQTQLHRFGRIKEALTKMMSKSQLIQEIADKHPNSLSRKDVKGVIESLATIGYKELKKSGTFLVPGFAKFVVIKKPATKERAGINPFTKEPTVFKAKPARKIVRARPVKAAKDAVA